MLVDVHVISAVITENKICVCAWTCFQMNAVEDGDGYLSLVVEEIMLALATDVICHLPPDRTRREITLYLSRNTNVALCVCYVVCMCVRERASGGLSKA